jgi:hypothetical protein
MVIIGALGWERPQKIVLNGPDGKTDWKATAPAREIAAARMMDRG